MLVKRSEKRFFRRKIQSSFRSGHSKLTWNQFSTKKILPNQNGIKNQKLQKIRESLPSAVFGGDVNSGMPLFFRVSVEVLRSSKFSCEDVTELCLDRGIVKPVFTLELELIFRLLLELKYKKKHYKPFHD